MEFKRKSPFFVLFLFIVVGLFIYWAVDLYYQSHSLHENLKKYESLTDKLSRLIIPLEGLPAEVGLFSSEKNAEAANARWRSKLVSLRAILNSMDSIIVDKKQPDSLFGTESPTVYLQPYLKIEFIDSTFTNSLKSIVQSILRMNEHFQGIIKSQYFNRTTEQQNNLRKDYLLAVDQIANAENHLNQKQKILNEEQHGLWNNVRYVFAGAILFGFFFFISAYKSRKKINSIIKSAESVSAITDVDQIVKEKINDVNAVMEFTVDKKENIYSSNKHGLKKLGVDESKLKTFNYFKLYHEEDRKKIEDLIEKCIDNFGKVFSWQLRKVDNNKKEIWVKETGRSFRDVYRRTVVKIESTDITEEKKLEEQIELQQQILSKVASVILVSDSEAQIRYVSPSVKDILGYETSELLGNCWWENPWYDLKDAEKEKEIAKERALGLTPINSKPYERFVKKKDSSPSWVLWQEAKGISNMLISVGTDITDSKEKEKALIDSENRYRLLFDSLGDSIFIYDNSGEISEINKAAYQLLGYTRDELLKIDISDIQSTQLHMDLKANEPSLRSGKQILNEGKIKEKSGNMIDVELSSRMMRMDGKQVVLSIVRDITKRKLDEQQIRMLSHAIEQSPASVIITEPDGTTIYVNPKFLEVTGYEFEEIIGKNPSILKSGKSPQQKYKDLWDTITSGNLWRGEFLNKKKNGDFYWEMASISPIKNNEGKITNYIAIKEDITERKNWEVQLRQAKDKAEEMNRLKSIFLYNMSHEFRTPMIGIIGYADILKDEIEELELRDIATNISLSGKRLTDTLNLVLDLTKIESGELEVSSEQINLIEIINEISTSLEKAAAEKNISFNLKDLPESAQAIVDKRLFEDAFYHVLQNGIKFTKEGGVEVLLTKEIIRDNNYILLKVRDTGIGIEPEFMDLIFEPFRQVSEGNDRAFEGAGLGLTIVKKFIEAMKGKIVIKSTPGKGTLVTMILPAA
ncbi:MAG: PAS domain-containing sensor histidine kinase [Bacteroidetes bacterium]|nr:PAS domain-containing sensor histidine kinase [Bacteroidota bacterium]